MIKLEIFFVNLKLVHYVMKSYTTLHISHNLLMVLHLLHKKIFYLLFLEIKSLE